MTKQRFFPFLAGFALALVFVLISAASLRQPTAYDVRKNTAEVEQIQGFWVFIDSKPVTEYDYLGTINGTRGRGSFNPQYTVIRDALLKLARKQYPDADGIILHLNAGGKDRADVLHFKEPKN